MTVELCMFIGLLAVASNPSPYFAALGLVGGSGAGCLMLAKGGFGFLCLVLFLVYLGGMMVVFAYCAALVAEPYPEAWGSHAVFINVIIYSVLVLFWMVWGWYGEVNTPFSGIGFTSGNDEWWGVGELLGRGGWLVGGGGWGLLLTLFVALELVRGYKGGGALRAV